MQLFFNLQILGRDASRAYVSGQFDEEGLNDDVTDLSPGDYIGLDEWITFYHKDYKYVGKLAGRYFDKDGSPTDYYRQMQQWLSDARDDAQTVENEKQIFPPCNSEWSAERGQRVWCTKKSGGISRNWIGVPRRLFFPGTYFRKTYNYRVFKMDWGHFKGLLWLQFWCQAFSPHHFYGGKMCTF